MRIEQNFSLRSYNTFRLPVQTFWFMEYADEAELLRILRDEYFCEQRSLHIGAGSNLLFLADFKGVILHSAIKGIHVTEETDDTVRLRVGAAEVWDDVVAFAVSRGWGGIENLSHIPGETGAAAVQNIGAYGTEIADAIETVEAYRQSTRERHVLSRDACGYGYRNSLFKESADDPYIVTYVNLRLQKHPTLHIDYGALRETLDAAGAPLSVQTVRDAVISIRRGKLPEPGEPGNAGSFFMNPVIPQARFEALKAQYPDAPSYPSDEGMVKVPAGWLIERCGLKGKRHGDVGVYEKQALVIVNYGDATGHEIALFAESIRQAVDERFGILLTPEVRYVE